MHDHSMELETGGLYRTLKFFHNTKIGKDETASSRKKSNNIQANMHSPL